MTLALDHYAYSLFAADAYRDPQDPPEEQDNYAPPPDGWTGDPVDQHWDEFAKQMNSEGRDPRSFGFFARTYYDSVTKKYVVSFRGTDDVSDWLNNNQELMADRVPDQAYVAYQYVEWLKTTGVDLADVTFTGHSLGGGLASMMAAYYGAEACVFDPAPVRASSADLLDGVPNFSGGPGVSDWPAIPEAPTLSEHGGDVQATLEAAEPNIHKVTLQGEAISRLYGGVDADVFLGTNAEVVSVAGASTNPDSAPGFALHSSLLLSALLAEPRLDVACDLLPDLGMRLIECDYISLGGSDFENDENFFQELVKKKQEGVDALGGLAADLETIAAHGAASGTVQTALIDLALLFARGQITADAPSASGCFAWDGVQLGVDLSGLAGLVDVAGLVPTGAMWSAFVQQAVPDVTINTFLQQPMIFDVGTTGAAVTGGASDDMVVAGLHGNAATITASGGADVLVGRGTADAADYSAMGAVSAVLADAIDPLFDARGTVVKTDGSVDALYGMEGIVTGSGADAFSVTSGAALRLDGGAGRDSVDYEGAGSIDVTVTTDGAGYAVTKASGATDILLNMEVLTGSAEADTIDGVTGGMLADAGGGDDLLRAGANGSSTLVGGYRRPEMLSFA